MDIFVYGAEGFGIEIIEYLYYFLPINADFKNWKIRGFLSDVREKENGGHVIYGNFEYLKFAYDKDDDIGVIIAVGDGKTRENIVKNLSSLNLNICFPNVFLNVLNFGKRVVGKGNIVCPGVITTCNVKIGDFNIINMSSTIGHDCIIGSFNTISPGVNISGNCYVGNYSCIGTNSSLIEKIKIGDNSKVVAGLVVNRNVKNNFCFGGENI